MKVMVIDVGGTHVKVLATGRETPVKIDSGLHMTPERMAAEVLKATSGWKYDAISIGCPGPVVRSRVTADPHNLGPGWVGFDFRKAFGRPVKIVNDAAMQALGSYEGGRMLFLGLGTGLGSALIVDGKLEPLELAHLPYKKKRSFEDYAGLRGLERLGKKKWRKHVAKIVGILKQGMQVEYIVLGGGNVKHLKQLPPDCKPGANANAFDGGFRLWDRRFEASTQEPLTDRPRRPGKSGRAR
jgi:polyphosphate glucokinase